MKNLILKAAIVLIFLTFVYGVYTLLDTYLTHEQSFAVLVAAAMTVFGFIFHKIYGFRGARTAINR